VWPTKQQEARQPEADSVRPAPAPEQPVQAAASTPAPATADEDPGFGPEPTWDSEPWDDGGGDWDATSVPVPDWEADLGTTPSESARDNGAAVPAPVAGETTRPAAPAPAAPKGYVAPAPSLGVADRPVAPPPGASAATWGMPVPVPAAASVEEPDAPAGGRAVANGGKLSRYQRLMNRAAGITDSGPAPVPARITTDPAAGAWGNPEDAPDFARPRPSAPVETPRPPVPVAPVELDDSEFVPSDDDIAIEDSSLIGVPAIERILNGRIIEERDAAGNVIERPNRPR
jgi:DNA polymerase-3 subunit gamma/tau